LNSNNEEEPIGYQEMVAFDVILSNYLGWDENARKDKVIMEAGVGEALSQFHACMDLTTPKLLLAVDKKKGFAKEKALLYDLHKGEKHKLEPVNFLVNDLLQPCFKLGSFDLIYCYRLFSSMKGIASQRKDIESLIASLHCLLKPNGKLLILEYHRKPRNEAQKTYLLYWNIKHRIWKRAKTGWPLLSFQELSKMLSGYDAGFIGGDFEIKVPRKEMKDYISYLRKILKPFPEEVAQEFEDDIKMLKARMEKYGMEILPYSIAIVTKE